MPKPDAGFTLLSGEEKRGEEIEVLEKQYRASGCTKKRATSRSSDFSNISHLLNTMKRPSALNAGEYFTIVGNMWINISSIIKVYSQTLTRF